MGFEDRADAGRCLARRLTQLRGADVVVLGVTRGGVPAAFEVAQALDAPLDVVVARKVSAPFQPELTMCAVAEKGVCVVNPETLHVAGVGPDDLAEIERATLVAIDRWARRLRHGRRPVPLTGRTAVIVDDGVATGTTARAACAVARRLAAYRVVLAVPVAPADVLTSLGHDADEVVCLHAPRWIPSLSQWYSEFTRPSNDELAAFLDRATTSSRPVT